MKSPSGAPRDYLSLARRLGDTLVHTSIPAPGAQGVSWENRHPLLAGFPSLDINAGNAGVVIALAALASVFGDTAHRTTLAEAARFLDKAPRPAGPPLPGLYVGEAGIGTALLRAGQALHDNTLIEAAAARGRRVAERPFASPDLFNGTAGRLRFHLWLWEATGGPEHLAAAVAAGEAIVAAGEPAGEDGLCWRIPDGYEGLSGSVQLGYAHGAAGIADSLLDLVEATGDRRFHEAARRAGRWLAALAMPALDDGSGASWPSLAGEPAHTAHWCHGSTGIGRFFLHAARLDLLSGAADLADRAARTVARAARWIGPVQCHGLAGNIELLIDMFQRTGSAAYLEDARELGELLSAFAVERGGDLFWLSESPTVVSPALMVGYSGIAACLLRLGAPERSPPLLNRWP